MCGGEGGRKVTQGGGQGGGGRRRPWGWEEEVMGAAMEEETRGWEEEDGGGGGGGGSLERGVKATGWGTAHYANQGPHNYIVHPIHRGFLSVPTSRSVYNVKWELLVSMCMHGGHYLETLSLHIYKYDMETTYMIRAENKDFRCMCQ